MNRELNTTIVIVTHDPDIAYKVGRVVLVRDGKTSTEIRRRVSYQRITGDAEADAALEEFTLVDGAGRVQIPREMLEELEDQGTRAAGGRGRQADRSIWRLTPFP